MRSSLLRKAPLFQISFFHALLKIYKEISTLLRVARWHTTGKRRIWWRQWRQLFNVSRSTTTPKLFRGYTIFHLWISNSFVLYEPICLLTLIWWGGGGVSNRSGLAQQPKRKAGTLKNSNETQDHVRRGPCKVLFARALQAAHTYSSYYPDQ